MCVISSLKDKLTLTISESVAVGSVLRIKVGILNPLAKVKANLTVQGLKRHGFRTVESGLFVSSL